MATSFATIRRRRPRLPEHRAQPVLHVIVGPNGSGKSTLYAQVVEPITRLEFINADVIAAQRWPGDEAARSYDAAALAAEQREERLRERRSFVTETMFSHPSKLAFLHHALASDYRVTLHVVVVPEELAVARVAARRANGGHDVPEEKVRGRYRRFWRHVADAIGVVDDALVYDNSRARVPFRRIARFDRGRLVGEGDWPAWAPAELVGLG